MDFKARHYINIVAHCANFSEQMWSRCAQWWFQPCLLEGLHFSWNYAFQVTYLNCSKSTNAPYIKQCIAYCLLKFLLSCDLPGEKYVGTIVDSISTLTAKWFSLGLALGLSYGTLKKIECDYQRDSSRCLAEVVAAWLQNTSQASWRGLAFALRLPSVSGFKVASNIAEEHPYISWVVQLKLSGMQSYFLACWNIFVNFM